MEMFSALQAFCDVPLALYEGNPQATNSPHKGPGIWTFDVAFHVRTKAVGQSVELLVI